MVDFQRLNDELDAAGYELHKVEEIYERTRNEIEAAPSDQRAALQSQFAALCHQRAAAAKHLLDAHIAASKGDHK